MLSSNFVWLADFHLTAICLLLLAGIAGSLIRQPARRLVVAWATTLGLALLLVLAALPGWSVWSLAGPGAEARPVAVLEEARPPTAEEALVVAPYVKVIPPPSAPASPGVVPPPITAVAEVREVDLAHEAARIVLPWYLLGVVLTAVWLLVGGVLARRLIRQAEEADPETRRLLEQLSDRPPRLLVSDRLSGPVAIGLLRPAIVLPRRLVERTDEAELRAVFAHELAHLRGGDLWLLAGLRLLMIPLWCNPLYWLLRRRVRLDQETLADAAAADQADRHAYAERLVGWARELRPQPQLAGAAGLWESPSQLRKRVAVLLDDSFSVLRRSTLGWRVACGAACLATAVAASLVTLGPTEVAALEEEQSRPAEVLTSNEENEAAVPPDGPVELSGRIVLENGETPDRKGWLYLHWERRTGEHSTSGGSSTIGEMLDRFRASSEAGEVWVTYFPEGYAPTWSERIALEPGESRDDLTLVLKPGSSAEVIVRDESGRPVQGAVVVCHPQIHDQAGGPIRKMVSDEAGRVRLEHLADTPYEFRVEAPGYQPLATDAKAIAPESTVSLTLVKSKPATGVVRFADGAPASGAKLRALQMFNPNGADYGFGNEGGGFWGEVLSEADAEGRFVLDELTDGAEYLMLIEGPDGSRTIVDLLRAGVTDVEIVLPARRDLIINVRGDLSRLKSARVTPYATVRQEVNVRRPDINFRDLIGDDPRIEPTEGGGRAVLRGLAVDSRSDAPDAKIRVGLCDRSIEGQTVLFNPDGNTEVLFVLPGVEIDQVASPVDDNLIRVIGWIDSAEQSQPQPVADASVTIVPVENEEGPVTHRTDANGLCPMPLEDKQPAYLVVNAPGYLPLRTAVRRASLLNEVTVWKRREGYGAVAFAAGTPAGARLFTRLDRLYDPTDRRGMRRAGEQPLSKTLSNPIDLMGRFRLADLASLAKPTRVIVEAVDGARTALTLSADTTEEEGLLVLDERVDIAVAVRGNLSAWPARSGKPRVRIRQRLDADSPWMTAEAPIETTKWGQSAIFRGLVTGELGEGEAVEYSLAYDDAPVQSTTLKQVAAKQARCVLQLPGAEQVKPPAPRLAIHAARTLASDAAVAEAKRLTPERVVTHSPKPGETEHLLLGAGGPIVTERDLLAASVSESEWNEGEFLVSLSLTAAGGERMKKATSKLMAEQRDPKPRMVILVDGRVDSAPTLNDKLGRSVQITGGFDQARAEELVALLTLSPADARSEGVTLQVPSAKGSSPASIAPEQPIKEDAIVLFAAPPTGALRSMKPGEPNSITGRCVDAAGEPLAGVEVLLFRRDGSLASSQRLDAATSDAAGGFRFDGVLDDPEEAAKSDPSLNPGADLYVLVARRAGYASQSTAQHESQIARGVRLTFRCQPAGTLAGRVTNADGRPVTGARVRVDVAGNFDLGNQAMHATLTDEEGRYAIADLPAGDFAAKRAEQERAFERAQTQGGMIDILSLPSEVTVLHPEHAILKRQVDRVPGTLDFRLQQAAVVEGRVVHDRGGSVEGLTVEIQPDDWTYKPGAASPVTQTVRVDSEGRYRFASLPAGKHFVRARGPFERDLVTLPVQKVRAVAGESATAPDLVVSDGRGVRFQLVDSETKEPLTFDEPLEGFAFYFPTGDDRTYGGSVTRTIPVGRDGRFEYRVANRETRMHLSLHLPTDHPQGMLPQSQVDVPAGEIEQPFPFPFDMSRVTGERALLELLMRRATRLQVAGEIDAAIDVLTEAIATRPKNAELLRQRATLLDQAKRDLEAIADYELAMKQEPEFLFILQNNLAYLLATTENPELRDPERAVQLARKAVEGAPPHPQVQFDVYDTLAMALEAAGDTAGAKAARKKASTVPLDTP